MKKCTEFKKGHLWEDQADVTLRSEQHYFFHWYFYIVVNTFFFSVSPGPGKC